MNKYLILFLLIYNVSTSQTISGNVIDSISKSKIPFVNMVLLNHNIGGYSNEEGYYQLEIQGKSNDTLKISSLGYKTKYIPLSSFKNKDIANIFLIENDINLEEVIISSKKINYSKNIKLGLEQKGNIGVSSLAGHQYCTLVKNPYRKNGKLKSVIIKLKKRKKSKYTASLRIHIYEYDEKEKKPKNELLLEDVIVKAKNKKYSLNVNLEKYNILFPKKGLCIGVEWIVSEIGIKKITKIGPMLRYTIINEINPSWTNYQNRGWKNGLVEYENKYAKPIIGIEVLMPK